MEFAAIAQRHVAAIIAIALFGGPALVAGAWTLAARGRRASAAAVAVAAGIVSATGAAVFIAIAARIARGTAFSSADQRMVDALRDGTPALAARCFAALTHLGDPWFLTLLSAFMCAWLLLTRRFALAVYFAAVTSAGGLLNQALKAMMRRDRPTGAGVPLPESFAFPSGHTFGSIVCYGMCAYVLLRLAPTRRDPLIVALACFIVLAIGVSRVVIGVHFPGDVIGGFASGGAWLAACIGAAEFVRRRARALSDHFE
ncbi:MULTISPECIES: phosphatase PAP2 family protein [unclassified Caballeronia]|uniref:phosphatase PAP2 family protein n=1 Tax=unclassified Caballeronia TaxID=2646786 RepID=UPI001F2E6E99|nr:MULTISPECIES: phosphatase PAP2 family protein [unclassified Caballeronia]MCE4547275.1 phosphatase PAP2 family protein [Caballeronia sp. PC1]MCE4575257.1 phosphatase PAP2 family protein [Caballeronia sp. CLC5]MDR5749114.1 phosphatase PAP2 family protein [Caballeronia sp. LZ029]